MDASRPADIPGLLRIATFRALPEGSGVAAALRSLGDQRWGRARWVGRRLLDDPTGMEVVVVSLWDDGPEMEQEVGTGQTRMTRELRAAVETVATDVYTCRAYGAWRRDAPPCLVRIFRGRLTAGDPAHFDARRMAELLRLVEPNPRCASIAVGIDAAGAVVLASLWTTWDAVLGASGRDLRRVLPLRLPGFDIDGAAVHYELVAAES